MGTVDTKELVATIEDGKHIILKGALGNGGLFRHSGKGKAV